MLKSCGWVVVGGGGLQDFSVIPRPLGFGFLGLGLRGLGPGLDDLFFTKKFSTLAPYVRFAAVSVWKNEYISIPEILSVCVATLKL